MSPRQIEAVFGHEAGHVRHHHLQFFVVFSVLSMLIVGGILELLTRYTAIGTGMLQLIAMIATLLAWGAGFGWVSRCFERQADIFGVRAITADIDDCSPDCVIHAAPNAVTAGLFAPGLCLGAAHVFGGTLQRIAELNGIPREAPSWRHGSINSRCRLVHDLADHPQQLTRFEFKVIQLKTGLITLTAIGLAIACWLYWPSHLFKKTQTILNRPLPAHFQR
jgi:STE24 endopeptidase